MHRCLSGVGDDRYKYMKYNLIADAGSTKIDWVSIDESGHEVCRFSTDGVNALLATASEVESSLKEVSDRLKSCINSDDSIPIAIESIYWYGAGCATPEICSKLADALKDVFCAEYVEVHSDLLGAARSLFGDRAGIACILGTGSNSCLYDGEKIVHNIPSLGYVLGDEGSGVALGKRLVADSFKGHLPKLISDKFLAQYGLTLADILDKVYRQPAPNKFLASLVPFISENLWNPYIYSMVRQEFSNFLNRNVSPYEGSRTLPISFAGSIALHFEKVLREAASEDGYAIGEIRQHPLDGLIEYHFHQRRK